MNINRSIPWLSLSRLVTTSESPPLHFGIGSTEPPSTMPRMLKIHEHTMADGGLASVFLRFDRGVLSVVDEEGAQVLPPNALPAVMERFGAPLALDAELVSVASLDLGDGGKLRHVRHLARYDVIARDYLVYDAPGREPRCALATTVAAALGHLARAAHGG